MWTWPSSMPLPLPMMKWWPRPWAACSLCWASMEAGSPLGEPVWWMTMACQRERSRARGEAAAKVGLAPAVLVLDVLRRVLGADVVVAVEGRALVVGREQGTGAGGEREQGERARRRGGAGEAGEPRGQWTVDGGHKGP